MRSLLLVASLVLICCAPPTLVIAADRASAAADGLDAVTLTATSPGADFIDFTASAGGQLTETHAKSTAAGLATTRLTAAAAGTITVTATAQGASGSTSVTFTAPAVGHLRFQTSPSNTLAQNLLRPVPVVVVEDGAGLVTSSSAAITVAITPGSCAASLDASSLSTVNADMGSASFYGLKSSTVASGCTLTATSGALQAAVSAAFDLR